MTDNKIERCYNSMFNCIQRMGRKDDVSFFEHYVEFLDCFLLNDFSELLQSFSDEDKIFFLENVNSIRKYNLGKEEKRKVSQLILLKGATLSPLQPNHQLTPDTIGFIFVYLIESLIGKTEKTIQICDLAVGSGNLLSTVMTNLQVASISTVGVGVDADELLLNIASVTADWIDLDVQLYLQDGLMPLIGESSDIAICDLPVGYYPDDERATDYRVCSEEGHTYAHHILMEQSMRNVRDKGFGLFLVPSNLFSSEQTPQLMRWIGQDVSLRAILQLPESLFKTKNSQKNIIIVQNEAPNTPEDTPLLARIPSLKKHGELADFFATFNSWAHELLNRNK